MKDFAVLIAGVQACRAVHDRILIRACSVVNCWTFFLVGRREGKVLFCLFVLLICLMFLTVIFFLFVIIIILVTHVNVFSFSLSFFEWEGFRHRHLIAFVSANVVAIFISIIIMERSGDAVWTFSLQHARGVYNSQFWLSFLLSFFILLLYKCDE